jgi:metal-responsive CopG/Arc/MetJ family transcriptional regulator
MANVKTAVSLPRRLFERVEEMSQEMKTPRSRLYARALQEFVSRHENQKLLEQTNAAYADFPDPTEERWLRFARRHHRHLAEGAW